jgi:hypothetical protein
MVQVWVGLEPEVEDRRLVGRAAGRDVERVVYLFP